MGGGRSEWVRGRCLGRGSTAAVYLAAFISGKPESFAVKCADLSRSAPLQREEKLLSSLCSPHIVSCLGSDVTTEPDGRVFYNLFMEYVPNGSLAEAIKRHGPLDVQVSRLYTRGILDGLADLHRRGIVHCDVKGQNILVGQDGMSVKLADLGCARWVKDGNDDGVVISGTPLYMAPEVARGEEQGPAADIWALGCTVIEMATGCPPWRDVADPVAAIHRIAFSGDVPEFPCNLCDDARDFLGRCLNRDPRKRWSAEELLNHPFANCGEESTAGWVPDSKRNSPKSILDQEFWDSWPEEDDDEEKGEAKPHMDNQPLESPQERLRQLVGGGASPSPAANTTWEGSSWLTIRNSDGLESSIWEDEASTSSLWAVESGVDRVAGTEGPAAYHDCTVVTTACYLPSNLSPHSALTDATTIYSSSVGERNDLVEETNSFPSDFSGHDTLTSKYYEYPTCYDLGLLPKTYAELGTSSMLSFHF